MKPSRDPFPFSLSLSLSLNVSLESSSMTMLLMKIWITVNYIFPHRATLASCIIRVSLNLLCTRLAKFVIALHVRRWHAWHRHYPCWIRVHTRWRGAVTLWLFRRAKSTRAIERASEAHFDELCHQSPNLFIVLRKYQISERKSTRFCSLL